MTVIPVRPDSVDRFVKKLEQRVSALERHSASALAHVTFAQTNVTGTTDATRTAIVTFPALEFDGATRIMVEIQISHVLMGTTYSAGKLYEGTTPIGDNFFYTEQAGWQSLGVARSSRFTPAVGTHTYLFGGLVGGGTGQVSVGHARIIRA